MLFSNEQESEIWISCDVMGKKAPSFFHVDCKHNFLFIIMHHHHEDLPIYWRKKDFFFLEQHAKQFSLFVLVCVAFIIEISQVEWRRRSCFVVGHYMNQKRRERKWDCSIKLTAWSFFFPWGFWCWMMMMMTSCFCDDEEGKEKECTKNTHTQNDSFLLRKRSCWMMMMMMGRKKRKVIIFQSVFEEGFFFVSMMRMCASTTSGSTFFLKPLKKTTLEKNLNLLFPVSIERTWSQKAMRTSSSCHGGKNDEVAFQYSLFTRKFLSLEAARFQRKRLRESRLTDWQQPFKQQPQQEAAASRTEASILSLIAS